MALCHNSGCACAYWQVLGELLDIMRQFQNQKHGARLEWIVIWLILLELVIGIFEVASIMGWLGHHPH